MKRAFSLCAAALMLTLALPVSALAAETAAVCYPTSVTRSEDGTELKKIYDLAPEEDPAGIPRSDFEQDGFRYTLTDLLKQELPEHDHLHARQSAADDVGCADFLYRRGAGVSL